MSSAFALRAHINKNISLETGPHFLIKTEKTIYVKLCWQNAEDLALPLYKYNAINCKIPHIRKYNPTAHLMSFGKTRTKSPKITARTAAIVKLIATMRYLR